MQTNITWSPTATLERLRQRAKVIAEIREFFYKRNVLEVETPLLSHATVSDPFIISIPAIFEKIGSGKEESVYLQTSPEYAMKRLLAAGSGAIYQITKSFRQGEIGRYHNPEFTMLEWYRPGFDHHALMDEMDELLQLVLRVRPAQRLSYSEVFKKFVGINPHTARITELVECAQENAIPFIANQESENQLEVISEDSKRNFWLDLLLTHCIEPYLGREAPLFLYDFPVSQAALAKIRQEDPPVASRFEVYFKGIELANGFHELQDAKEQRRRFENDLQIRIDKGIPVIPLDENFLAALEHGFPDCAGVALGVDRLVMLATESETVSDVIGFVFDRA